MSAGIALSYAAAFCPVLVFLACLRVMDSYKLTPRSRILMGLAFGAASAILCYAINTLGFRHFNASFAHIGAPAIEELAKATYWIFLIATARVAFMVDSGICAFAIGAGFSLVENFLYLQDGNTSSLPISILRGFGTALMHGGVASIAAMVSVFMAERFAVSGLKQFLPGITLAIAIHSFFNSGILPPLPATLVMLIAMPLLIIGVFLWSESALRHWLGDKLDQDIDILDQILTGDLSNTRSGAYLQSLQDAFPAEIRGDMLCLLQLTTELSIRAKGDMLLLEAGLEIPPDPELESRFEELAYLEKSIGPTGMRAISPLLSRTPRDLWELRRLAQTN